MSVPIIEAKNVTKKFKDIVAVDNLSFTINKGDVYGFLGQNGAGKSTCIRMMLSLIYPTNGDIYFWDKPLQNNRTAVLQKVGAVIEKPDLYKYLTGAENIRLFSKLTGQKISQKQIDDTLKITGIDHASDRKIKTYSQGMKQRLGIAIALVHNPEIIILDEPTNGLDPQGIVDIRNLIFKLSTENNKTVVISTHLLSEIEQVASRILIINKGKKVVEGSKDELLNPNQTQLEIETGKTEQLFTFLQNSEWKTGNPNVISNGVKITIKKSEIPLLNKAIVAQDIPVFKITPRNHLENYFINITKD
jgi:ABC-type multidrug transport system ATPase subunit